MHHPTESTEGLKGTPGMERVSELMDGVPSKDGKFLSTYEPCSCSNLVW